MILFACSVLSMVLILIISDIYVDINKNAKDILKLNPNISRVLNITYNSRKEANDYAIREILKNPIIGVGMDEYSQNPYAPIDNQGNPNGVHNALIRSFLGGGILVFLGYLYIYCFGIYLAYKSYKKWLSNRYRPWLIGLASSVLTFIIIDMAQPTTHWRISWLFLFILFSVVNDQTYRISKRI